VTTALTLILLGPLVLLWMFVLVLAVQALANLLPARPDARGPECTSGAGKFVILMPAHNEEAIIEDTVRHTLSKLGPTGRLLVIADNCTDSTARRARAAGAEVTERHDPHHRGKGYALAHGVDQLHFRFAVLAPVGPEAQHDRTAGESGREVDGRAIGPHGFEGRCGIASVEPGRRLAAAGSQKTDEEQEEEWFHANRIRLERQIMTLAIRANKP